MVYFADGLLLMHYSISMHVVRVINLFSIVPDEPLLDHNFTLNTDNYIQSIGKLMIVLSQIWCWLLLVQTWNDEIAEQHLYLYFFCWWSLLLRVCLFFNVQKPINMTMIVLWDDDPRLTWGSLFIDNIIYIYNDFLKCVKTKLSKHIENSVWEFINIENSVKR